MPEPTPKPLPARAWIVTGPTSGIGYRTALDLAEHGTVILVGRSHNKLDHLQNEIETAGGHAVSVICDLSDIVTVHRAAADIAALDLPVAGLLNNAGIAPTRGFTSAQGWDGTYATDHLGPFALTEALMPVLPDGANVVFIVSAVEDPQRKPATIAGFRGGRYISAEASARGEWLTPGGSKLPGGDAYATAKQGISPPHWPLPAKPRGSASMPSNRVSAPAPTSGAMRTSRCASCPSTCSHRLHRLRR